MALISRFKRILFGEPLSNSMMEHEKIGKVKALAILSSDALSSVAYATEEILIPLSLFSVAAVAWSIPIAIAIAALLVIVILSYRQTIDSYPSGGGAYIVAKDNLGTKAGLVAAAALLIDYVLTVAVSVSAGVANITSAVPFLRAHNELFGVIVVIFIMILNLRGVRESSTLFTAPTYFFIVSFLFMIAVGAWKLITGDTTPVAPIVHESYPAISIFLALKAFASGCSALTGVEAISNGIPIFQVPSQKNAKKTLLWMAIILGTFFLSITFLAHSYGIIPSESETVVSQLSHTIFGDSFAYYLVQCSIACILVLAANTSYADFPRLASLLAKDRFLPRQMAILGDRLVFSNGIIGLSVAAIFLIILFEGDTHLLIPLYAVGVFLSFTLSQSGMILHHLREREPHWLKSLFFNALGAITTCVVLIVIASTKFFHGAWMIVLLIPILVFIFLKINRHYLSVGKELALPPSEMAPALNKIHHIVIIPLSGIHRGVVDALRYGHSISNDVRAVYVSLDDDATARMQHDWKPWAHEISLVTLKSPYRSVVTPLLDYINDIAYSGSDELVTVIIPEFVTAKWWHSFLHNQTALFIRAALMFKPRVVVTAVRYHLKST